MQLINLEDAFNRTKERKTNNILIKSDAEIRPVEIGRIMTIIWNGSPQ
jgi:hypothetical protein